VKIDIFWYKFVLKGANPFKRFFTKFGVGEESNVYTLTPNFIVLVLEVCAFCPQNGQNRQFLV